MKNFKSTLRTLLACGALAMFSSSFGQNYVATNADGSTLTFLSPGPYGSQTTSTSASVDVSFDQDEVDNPTTYSWSISANAVVDLSDGTDQGPLFWGANVYVSIDATYAGASGQAEPPATITLTWAAADGDLGADCVGRTGSCPNNSSSLYSNLIEKLSNGDLPDSDQSYSVILHRVNPVKTGNVWTCSYSGTGTIDQITGNMTQDGADACTAEVDYATSGTPTLSTWN